jgi:hypothetical protein
MSKVFTYWEGNCYGYIQLCHDTLKRHNKEFTLLTPDDVKNEPAMERFINDEYYNSLMPAHRADIIRIKYLEKYGGVWIDSDFIAMNSFDVLIEASTRLHSLYYYRDSWQATNGILIAPKNHSMIVEWSRKIDCVYSNLKRHNRIPNPNNNWCAFGADQLKVCIDNAIDRHQDLGWDRVQLIPYGDLSRYFLTRSNMSDFRDIAWPGCYGYMLFNTGFPDWFKKVSKQEVMDGDWFITFLFKLALGLESF